MSFYVLGIDTGGTFTDFILLQKDQTIKKWKVLSTPKDPSIAIIEGLKEFANEIDIDDLSIVHGTTVGTNAFLERKGAYTCLITTKGFEDVLFIGRQARDKLYDLFVERPPNIIERDDVFGIDERIDAKGTILKSPDEKELKKAYSFIKEKGFEAVAVCLLHSYKNPENEKKLGIFLKEKGIEPILSSHLLPEFREFERTSTTVINAYLGPIVGAYIKKLEKKLDTKRLFIQLSSGGCQPSTNIEKSAVSTILSGPAGGVLASLELGKSLGIDNIITFDMGGTSTDVSLCPGKLLYTRDYKIQGFPINLPMIDVHTVGAGGGSKAWIDKGGLLKVGPQSAGADPGPICYGKGTELTVTDANLFLGRLRADKFLAGRMKLFDRAVKDAMEKLALRVGLTPVETALGIIRLVNTNMVQAVREVSIEKGYDPRRFSMVCFGGAAGLHALEVAEELEIERVIIPNTAGVFSAVGLAASDFIFERSKSLFLQISPDEDVNEIIFREEKELEKLIFEQIPQELLNEASYLTNCFLDVRYKGQSFELMIPLSEKWYLEFHKEHKRLYGYNLLTQPLEITSMRSRVIIKRHKKQELFSEVKIDLLEDRLKPLSISEYESGQVIFKDGAKQIPIIDREKIKDNFYLYGPLLITDDFTTILILDGWKVFNVNGHLIARKSN